MTETFTILDEDEPREVEATIVGERVLVDAGEIERALGWTLRPEGFCRDDVCVPVRDPSIVTGDGVDLQGFASMLGRPVALDVDERAAALGTAADARGAALRTLEAPEFTLPDLSGHMHSLSDFRGQKIFLAVWASW